MYIQYSRPKALPVSLNDSLQVFQKLKWNVVETQFYVEHFGSYRVVWLSPKIFT